MKQLLLILMLFVLGTSPSFAQKEINETDTCGTKKPTRKDAEKLPWYGNNEFLYDFLDISK
ncbi:hypothetical protein ACE193_03295 [Bernardetia sp. OM2101]|uniref:hypothetical protein n=1 Tax=Bernardetia sp. OM2101 TaxID=3344876 RepID=UPI0035CF4C5C